MSEESTVKNITLTYDDGTTEIVAKGLVTRFIEHDDGETTASFDMVSIAGKDLYMVVTAMLQLGYKIGYFSKEGDDDNV
ncbi:hypothetical protein [Anaerotignum sp. MB30-C6]|uniref:hypothetical protein n=1 Tax=Anaerotignum sp. MB30-C6 TaxID=3070814 RepID=UPI0027DB1311|nr:hypothetical protein [Anaerotignum sp. MB30-C6]WMI81929.1 hypothetical protein RBQ60_04145 [Anaerotignum sp. MB30-C6]